MRYSSVLLKNIVARRIYLCLIKGEHGAVQIFFLMIRRPPRPTLFRYTTLCRAHENSCRRPKKAGVRSDIRTRSRQSRRKSRGSGLTFKKPGVRSEIRTRSRQSRSANQLAPGHAITGKTLLEVANDPKKRGSDTVLNYKPIR